MFQIFIFKIFSSFFSTRLWITALALQIRILQKCLLADQYRVQVTCTKDHRRQNQGWNFHRYCLRNYKEGGKNYAWLAHTPSKQQLFTLIQRWTNNMHRPSWMVKAYLCSRDDLPGRFVSQEMYAGHQVSRISWSQWLQRLVTCAVQLPSSALVDAKTYQVKSRLFSHFTTTKLICIIICLQFTDLDESVPIKNWNHFSLSSVIVSKPAEHACGRGSIHMHVHCKTGLMSQTR